MFINYYNILTFLTLFRYVKTFDVCIIDEASQCTESWSMVPLQYQITSFILVGDSKQLSPVVLSQVFLRPDQRFRSMNSYEI